MDQRSLADTDQLQAAMTRLFADWVRELDLRVIEARAGEVVLALPISARFIQDGGVLCGASLMAAVESAMVLAVMTKLGGYKPMNTVQMQTSFLRPISGYSGVVRVIARVLRMSRTMAFGEVQIVSADDELAAHATSTIELH
jgi:uncharacterized protein (TIGR00369 family)